MFYNNYVRITQTRLDFANPVLLGISSSNINKLQRVQNCLARVVLLDQSSPSTSLLSQLHWLPVPKVLGLGSLISPVCLGGARLPDLQDMNTRFVSVIRPSGPACHVGVNVKAVIIKILFIYKFKLFRKCHINWNSWCWDKTATVRAKYGSSSSVRSSTPRPRHASPPLTRR